MLRWSRRCCEGEKPETRWEWTKIGKERNCKLKHVRKEHEREGREGWVVTSPEEKKWLSQSIRSMIFVFNRIRIHFVVSLTLYWMESSGRKKVFKKKAWGSRRYINDEEQQEIELTLFLSLPQLFFLQRGKEWLVYTFALYFTTHLFDTFLFMRHRFKGRKAWIASSFVLSSFLHSFLDFFLFSFFMKEDRVRKKQRGAGVRTAKK